ncbi:hypothetical protein CBW54_09670 [Yersinia kristensenii]|nr:hypothetical protein CBW54_09670 [Yersinia kristensenii]
MIPRSHSLIPLRPERQAVIKAIAFVDAKRETEPCWKIADYPYVQAFFRFLCGKGKVTGKNLNKVAGVRWDPKERLSSLADWERGLDMFISSEGRYCPTPLPSDLATYIFPELAFSRAERKDKRWKRGFQQYSRQQDKERNREEEKYQSVVGQAEIELAFQTPETLRSWYAHWSQQDIRSYDLEHMVWAWMGRFPSLIEVHRWYYRGQEPLWRMMDFVRQISQNISAEQQALDRWLVPNKLLFREASDE